MEKEKKVEKEVESESTVDRDPCDRLILLKKISSIGLMNERYTEALKKPGLYVQLSVPRENSEYPNLLGSLSDPEIREEIRLAVLDRAEKVKEQIDDLTRKLLHGKDEDLIEVLGNAERWHSDTNL